MADNHDLRQKAEKLALEKAVLENIESLSPAEARQMLHELRVHQIELEMQNEELRAAQEALDISHARYQDLYDFAPVGYITLSEQGIILEANLTAATLLDEPRSNLVKRPISGYILSQDQDIYYRHRKRLFESGEPQECELQMVKKDGAIFWARLDATASEDPGGLPACRLVLSDITGRRQAEKNLNLAHDKMLAILDSIDSTVYVADMDTHEILFMNKKMITDFGGDKTGKRCFRAFREKSEPCEFCTNDRLADKNGNPADGCTWHDQNPVTGKFYINHDRAIEWVDGRLVRLQIATDITDLKKMEAQLIQAQKMESIGTLAGGIAHDFNNILFPIIGHTEMLMDDLSGEDSTIQNSLREIYAGALRARDLVKQILAFARQEKSEFTRMKMQPIISEAMKLIRSTIPATIAITQHLQPDCGPVSADPTQIHQIVMNLATNAYHAMEETGGDLKVALKEMELGKDDLINPDMSPGPYACLSFADTGAGINKDVMARIFDPFFTTKGTGKGTGMGLSMVHGIVRGMKGDIRVYSEPGKGAEFQVYLPIAGNASEKEEFMADEPIPGGCERLLLVDDEKAIIAIGKRILERLGYQVTTRPGSLEGLEAFRADPDQFDLVITDMSMPNMPGDKLAVELIKIRPDISVLLCTGHREGMTAEKLESLGIKGFLMKPFMIKELAQKIRDVLDGSRDQTP
jgi:PAS domain S-box-containing protein